MNIDLIVAVVLAVLLLILIALRTHSALMILASSAGFVLSSLWGVTIYDALINFTDYFENDSGLIFIKVGLFLALPIMIALHFRKTQSHRMIQQIVPAVFWVTFTASMTISLLPNMMQEYLKANSHIVFMSQEFLNILVLVSILVAMVELMSERTRPKVGRPKGH